MFRRLAEYVLIKLHILEGRVAKDAITALIGLLPCIIASAIILEAMRQLGLEMKVPWHRRIWYKLSRKCRRWRLAIIGW